MAKKKASKHLQKLLNPLSSRLCFPGVDSYVQFVLNTHSFPLTELNTPLCFWATASQTVAVKESFCKQQQLLFSFLQTAASKIT